MDVFVLKEPLLNTHFITELHVDCSVSHSGILVSLLLLFCMFADLISPSARPYNCFKIMKPIFPKYVPLAQVHCNWDNSSNLLHALLPNLKCYISQLRCLCYVQFGKMEIQ